MNHINNKGYEVEHSMMKWFKGIPHKLDCVDFCTKTSLYEVKSCRMLNHTTNNNHKRHSAGKIHKRITGMQLGRFFVRNENHELLKLNADKENKIPKYIFVISIGKQKVWKVVSWEYVNGLIEENKRDTTIKIKDIFLEI